MIDQRVAVTCRVLEDCGGPVGVSGDVRVRTARGQTDMRGLATAGRAVRLERPLV